MRPHPRLQAPAPPSGGFGFRRTTAADTNQR